jgi:hypothetical protein
MLLLQLLRVVWPTPEVGIGFTLGLTFAMVNFREGKLAPKHKKVLRARAFFFVRALALEAEFALSIVDRSLVAFPVVDAAWGGHNVAAGVEE